VLPVSPELRRTFGHTSTTRESRIKVLKISKSHFKVAMKIREGLYENRCSREFHEVTITVCRTSLILFQMFTQWLATCT
jgi:hypothetical protein